MGEKSKTKQTEKKKFHPWVYYFDRAAIMKRHSLLASTMDMYFLTVLEVKVSAGVFSLEATVLGSLSLCPHTPLSLGLSIPRVSFCVF